MIRAISASIAGKVILGQRAVTGVDVVIETRPRRRAKAKLGSRKQPDDGTAEDVRGGVPQDTEGVRVLAGQEPEFVVIAVGPRQPLVEIVKLPIVRRHHRVLGETRTEALGDFPERRSGMDRLGFAVRHFKMKHRTSYPSAPAASVSQTNPILICQYTREDSNL